MAFYHDHASAQCCGLELQHVAAAAIPDDELTTLINRLAQVIYAGQGAGGELLLDLPLYELINKQLQAGLDIAFDSPDKRLKQFLSRNIQKFSGFKSHQVCQAITEKLTDAEGKIRPFKDFKADALELNALYNKHYLETEYNQAVASAQMASKWSQFEDDALLKFVTVGDDLVRNDHKKLDGITLPRSDDFWLRYYPPLEWNCRCTVYEVGPDEVHSTAEQLQGLPDIDGLFANNVGLSGELFSPAHPYFDVSEQVAKKISQQLSLDL